MKLKFFIEHDGTTEHCAYYYHTSETIEIPDDILPEDIKKAITDKDKRIDGIEIV